MSPWGGVFAGNWWEGFNVQGSDGNLWSGSANPVWSGGAFSANFGADAVSPGYYSNRGYGYGVRCLLN